MKNNKEVKQKPGFIKDIRNAIPKHCSNCGHKYKDSDLTLVQKDDYNAMLHLTCSNCHETYLINVVSPMGMLSGSSRMPLKIDIESAKEAKKFIGRKAVSSDEVLDVHKALKNMDTAEDLEKILKPSSGSKK